MPDVNSYEIYTLTQETKYALAYMWNEKKLAKDLYLALNTLYPTKQLYNIATNLETLHEESVRSLVEKYDLNITNLVDYKENYSKEDLENLNQGELHRSLTTTLRYHYAMGSLSQEEALKVGCMVEITDILDLDEYIENAQALDVIDVFNFLKDGSYQHYQAFNQGLQALGVSEGCCVVGEIDGVDYCRLEYLEK